MVNLGLEAPTIKNKYAENRRNLEKFNFDILCLWRDKSAANTKEVIFENK